MKIRIALIGDYTPDVVAHRAIPVALDLAATAEDQAATWEWVHTTKLKNPAKELESFTAIWVVPASPYANMAGVLDTIRWARETKRPMLGSCGGFQHMLLEFARNCAGIVDADHAETNPA
ncbi:MAG: synthase, partial [Verrucomicrobia bacterium]|nr:synthase [Verrucomicrobiota bacterium]